MKEKSEGKVYRIRRKLFSLAVLIVLILNQYIYMIQHTQNVPKCLSYYLAQNYII